MQATSGGRAMAGFCIAIANFLVVLDLTIANVSMPHIAGSLGISLQQGNWIITSYAVSEAIIVPMTGAIAQRVGASRMFILCIAGFGLFSMLCGVSGVLELLIFFRVCQGLCGGLVMPLSQTLMMQIFPPEKRGMAVGSLAMATLLGPVMGPNLGGVISEAFSWHWIFLINVPIVALIVPVCAVYLKGIQGDTRQSSIDYIGFALLVVAVGTFQVMLDIGRDRDWFADGLVCALAVCAILSFLAFIIWELGESSPLVDLRIFRHKRFTLSVLALALSNSGFFVSVVVVPQWLQMSLGYPASLAGMAVSTGAIAAIFTAPLSARLVNRFEPKYIVAIAALWLSLMCVMRAQWSGDSEFSSIVLPQLLEGLAWLFMMSPLMLVALSSVEPAEIATAAGIQSFFRTITVAISTTVALTLWGDGQVVARSELAGSIRPDNFSGFQEYFSSPEISIGIVSGIIDREAATIAFNQLSISTAFLLAFAAIVICVSPPLRQARKDLQKSS